MCTHRSTAMYTNSRTRTTQTHTQIIDGTTTHPRIISPFDETGVLHLRYILVHVIRRTDRTIVIIRVVVPGTYYQTVVGRRIPTHVVVVVPPPLLFETCHLFFIYLDSRRALLATVHTCDKNSLETWFRFRGRFVWSSSPVSLFCLFPTT